MSNTDDSARKRVLDEALESIDDRHKDKKILYSKDNPESESPTPSINKTHLTYELNAFKTPPPKSKSTVTKETPSKATPRHTAEFGLTAPDATPILEKINSFPVLIETVRQVVENCRGVIDEEKLLGQLLLSGVYNFTGLKKAKTFSSLTSGHNTIMLERGVFVEAGELVFQSDLLPNLYTSFFERMLDMFLQFTSRTTETGCRTIINAFLYYALKCSIGIYGQKNVAVFTEIAVDDPDIPGIGMVGGNLDFLVAKVNGNRDPRKHGEQITATQPYLTVIEAKKGETVRELSSVTQLIAQLISVDHMERRKTKIKSGRVGVLTDGSEWTFYYLDPYEKSLQENQDLWKDGADLFITQRISATTRENIILILGVLTAFIGGVVPFSAEHGEEEVLRNPISLVRLI